MHNLSQHGGPGKCRSYWEPDVHVVVEVKGDTGLVYAIRSEKDKSDKVRVVHRNHLLPCSSLPLEFPTELQKPRKTRKTSKKKVVAQEVEDVNDTDSGEGVKVWVTNKPTENASEDFNSNDASVCDDDVESLSSESESKLLKDADIEVPVETEAGDVHADVGSDEILQPEPDEDIQDPEGWKMLLKVGKKRQFLKNNQMCVHRELEDHVIDLRTVTGDLDYHQSIK